MFLANHPATNHTPTVVNNTMTKIAKILLLGILLLFNSCENKNTSPELKKYFSLNQISDFRVITEFFAEQICQNSEKMDFKSCFKKMLPELVDRGWNPILENIDFEKQKEMYKSISTTTFNEIWSYGKMRKYADKTEYKSIGINTRGKYLNYLKNVGIKNKYVAKYTEEIYSRGDIEGMGLLQRYILKNPNDLDLNDFNIQILISIHYLTQNDHEKRVETWIEK